VRDYQPACDDARAQPWPGRVASGWGGVRLDDVRLGGVRLGGVTPVASGRKDSEPMPVIAGAEPYSHAGGSTGVLLCHGFTGSPHSLRPWAEYLAGAGLSVSVPRLPGHGTTWQEMSRTRWEDWYAEVDRGYEELRGRSGEIFVMGLSMGGCLALRMAELRGTGVSGLVLVNPSLAADTKLFMLAPLLKLVIPSLKGVGSDIKKEGVRELAYDRVPVRAAATLPALWRLTQSRLGEVTQPVLVYRSAADHVVGPASMRVLQAALPPAQLTVRDCPDSYHVATLDNDAQTIFAGSLAFVRSHSHAERG
jgi:carboxylesterase